MRKKKSLSDSEIQKLFDMWMPIVFYIFSYVFLVMYFGFRNDIIGGLPGFIESAFSSVVFKRYILGFGGFIFALSGAILGNLIMVKAFGYKGSLNPFKGIEFLRLKYYKPLGLSVVFIIVFECVILALK